MKASQGVTLFITGTRTSAHLRLPSRCARGIMKKRLVPFSAPPALPPRNNWRGLPHEKIHRNNHILNPLPRSGASSITVASPVFPPPPTRFPALRLSTRLCRQLRFLRAQEILYVCRPRHSWFDFLYHPASYIFIRLIHDGLPLAFPFLAIGFLQRDPSPVRVSVLTTILHPAFQKVAEFLPRLRFHQSNGLRIAVKREHAHNIRPMLVVRKGHHCVVKVATICKLLSPAKYSGSAREL